VALNNPLVVLVLAVALASSLLYSFLNVNVEATPIRPPRSSRSSRNSWCLGEEVRAQVTIPWKDLFGMPGLKAVRSKSLYGLSDLKMSWNLGKRFTYGGRAPGVIAGVGDATSQASPGLTRHLGGSGDGRA